MLILRVGVLEQDGRSSICLVKNISSMGVQVKLYAKLDACGEISLRVADEPPVRGRVTWVRDGKAGISFAQELDGESLLRVRQKLRPSRRRAMPRVSLRAAVTIRTVGRTCGATLCDISSIGARVRTRSRLGVGDSAMVALPDMPPIRAYVRWSDGEESGLAFDTPIPMQVIARWLDGGVQLSA